MSVHPAQRQNEGLLAQRCSPCNCPEVSQTLRANQIPKRYTPYLGRVYEAGATQISHMRFARDLVPTPKTTCFFFKSRWAIRAEERCTRPKKAMTSWLNERNRQYVQAASRVPDLPPCSQSFQKALFQEYAIKYKGLLGILMMV